MGSIWSKQIKLEKDRWIGSYYSRGQPGLDPAVCGHSGLFFLPDLETGDLSPSYVLLGAQRSGNLPNQLGMLCHLPTTEARARRGSGTHPVSILELGVLRPRERKRHASVHMALYGGGEPGIS